MTRQTSASTSTHASARTRAATTRVTRVTTWIGLALLGVGALTSASCTLLWWLNQDPEGLPCDFSADPTGKKGACLTGYVCVTVDEGQDTAKHQECLKAGIKQKGDPCASNEECGQDLVCGTGYESCTANADNINCVLASDADKKLACRTKCDPTKPEATCNAGERCFSDLAGDFFCQQGTCGSDTDCDASGHPSTCHDILAATSGRSGLCQQTCEPLNCDPASKTCPDCTGVDGQVDANVNCIEPVDAAPAPANAVTPICEGLGSQLLASFTACNVATDQCEAGSFCNAFLSPGGAGAVCTPWCDVGGGNPACDTDSTGATRQCIPLVPGSNDGYCSP